MTKPTIVALLLFVIQVNLAYGQQVQKTAEDSNILNLAPKYEGYLFAYFEGSSGNRKHQEQLRFAISNDALNWKALNNNEPILNSDAISQSGGIRDPHILRSNDEKTFMIVATDMSTASNGWKENPGIVLLKSTDLINWKHGTVNLAKDYPEKFADAYWIWAPQTIYDKAAKKYMVYFTVKFRDDDHLDFYYAYANNDFNGFENEPQFMFRAKYGAIDGDIIYKDGMYHLFFKGNTKDENGVEFENGIKQAVSKSLQGPWEEHFEFLDAYKNSKTGVEGSSIFKLNNSETYILMYDLFSSGRYEFQRSTDLYNFTEKPEAFTKNFHPRHGSVISITQEEVDRLNNKWGEKREYKFQSNGNPIITHKFTPDPAALVLGDTLWLFTGHDVAKKNERMRLKDWCVFSTTDLKNWTEYPTPLKVADFAWDKTGRAYASQAIERNGKYYWYISTDGSGIGVAVADRPQGPYKDAIGKPLLTNEHCFASTHNWVCIDPTVIIDDDGQAWIFWGNKQCYYAKLKENMIEIDGEVKQVKFDGFEFTEAPWIHKYKGKYYLSYATGYPERIAYAMADNIEGPYEYKGILNEIAGNSDTNHQSIIEFKGQWYFIYHNGGHQPDGSSSTRSTCIDRLYYNRDKTLKRVIMTKAGVNGIYK